MIKHRQFRLTKLTLSLALALSSASALSQNTTSGISGLITGNDGMPVNGAKVTIVHTESGSVNNTLTDAQGRYTARGLRVGGPYTITITRDGVSEKREGVYVQLAETANVDAKIGEVAVQVVEVTGSTGRSDKFNKSNMGAGTNIGSRELAALGSIQRNLADYARTDPRISQTDKERGEISAGGQNSRFNSITIDGVAINDTFGLESNGLPTAKQPISIDAIQSVQVNVSNYDVTQKGYTGANINAVTKSGTNEFKGSVYYVFRNDKLVGQRYNATTDTYYDAPTFQENVKGVTAGGPLIKDKLFFFASLEELNSTRAAPSFGPIGSMQTNVGITPSLITGSQTIAKTKYAMDIGSSDVPDGTKLVVKDALLKVDWNINDDHRASVRYSKTEQTEPQFPNINSTGLSLNSQWYTQAKTIETTVAQWFADWSSILSTELKVSSRNYNSVPSNNSNLPAMSFAVAGALPAGAPSTIPSGTRFLNFGTEQSRQNNILETKTIDAYFGANLILGSHELKFGGDYSKNDVYNAFLQNVNGNYTFGCSNSTTTLTYSFGAIDCAKASAAQVEAAMLENFSRGRPNSFQVQVPVAGGTFSNAIAEFSLKNYGAFLQDTWKVNKNLTLMYGVRLDAPRMDDKPLANAAAAAPMVAGNAATNTRQSGGFGMDNTQTVDGEDLYQPRIGFNYTFDAERATQLRGGVGLFQGAAANVWLSNPFSNTGVATRIIGCGTSGFSACPGTDGTFNPDPSKQPTNFIGATPAANVDFLQPGLGQPAVWKANLAFEHELPWFGLVLGAEYLYTKNKVGIYYEHMNLGAPTKQGTDGRDLFYTSQGYNPACWTTTGSSLSSGVCSGFRAKALSNPKFNNVLVAAKTDEGGGNLGTVSLSSPQKSGLGWSMAYTYTDATEVSPLTSSVSNSNWAARSSFNPNEQVAANSAALVKDRINLTLTWQKNLISNFKTTFGMFYEGRSGKPYSWTIKNDLNGDGVGGNDLMYIPSAMGSNQVVFLGDTATNHANEQRFWDIVNSSPELAKSAGGVTKRNDSFSPWTNSFDLRLSQELPGFFGKNKGAFILDLFNVGNLINKKWGRINEVLFRSNGGAARSFVDYVGIDSSGRYIYNVKSSVESTEVRQVKGESQWAIQATLRYEF
ncbi:carboxypeptidase regulatory-like domain-containing protein [Undibacterium sp. Ren11W]|uniref:TonB-dependent receptor n=1 Tax=Undibacterium sp. Ren11W TaxID=3413045 RepID=UPI003BF32883